METFTKTYRYKNNTERYKQHTDNLVNPKRHILNHCQNKKGF